MRMELIQDDKKRMTTLVKWKGNLVKKISELSILCDIKACMIIYDGNNHQIWPHDSNEVEELINLYKNQPLEGRSKRNKSLSNYFKNDQKIKADIKVEKYPTWDSRFDYLSSENLQNLAGVLEKRMQNAKGRVEFLKSTKVEDSNIGSSLSHHEIWDNDNLKQSTMWPMNSFTDYENFFQSNIPICGVDSVGVGTDNGLLSVDDYQFGNADYFMMIERENWSADNENGSSLTMQPMTNNEIGSSLTMQSMENNGIGTSSIMLTMANNGIGSSATMQPMANNGIDSTSMMQPMANNGISSSLTMQIMDQWPFIYNDSTHDMPYVFL